jgi:DNA polymerase III alpha subunit
LARPGPLQSGGTTEFVLRRTGKSPITFLHPSAKEITKVTFGVIVYQEQVMQIAREIGGLKWEDVSALRRAMSKSMGKEFFNTYWKKFEAGARKNGLKTAEARLLWDNINTMGSWAFNRSHAVAYGMISYWCCVLKAHFPLEFAAANLRNQKSDDQSIKVLRELVTEGYEYKPYDPFLSEVNWTVAEGKLIGGLMSIHGVGPRKAESIIAKRATHGGLNGTPYSRSEIEFLNNGRTPWDKIFEARDLWGRIFKHPDRYNIITPLTFIKDIVENYVGEYVFIAKLASKNLRDHNELHNLEKRGGRRIEGQTKFLQATVEDDTGTIHIVINRHLFEQFGRPLVEQAKLGDWFLWKGQVKRGFKQVEISRWIRLTGNEKFSGRGNSLPDKPKTNDESHHMRNERRYGAAKQRQKAHQTAKTRGTARTGGIP